MSQSYFRSTNIGF